MKLDAGVGVLVEHCHSISQKLLGPLTFKLHATLLSIQVEIAQWELELPVLEAW